MTRQDEYIIQLSNELLVTEQKLRAKEAEIKVLEKQLAERDEEIDELQDTVYGLTEGLRVVLK